MDGRAPRPHHSRGTGRPLRRHTRRRRRGRGGRLGALERIDSDADTFLVPSPQELSVAVELHAAGVPLSAIACHLRELRGQVEHVAVRFLEFTTEHVFARYLEDPGHRTDTHAAEAAALVRRLRPLAQRTVDAELSCAMRALATRQLRTHLIAGTPRKPPPGAVPSLCPLRRQALWKGLLDVKVSPSSSRWQPNGRCVPAPWTASPQAPGEERNFANHLSMHAPCPQTRQFPCG